MLTTFKKESATTEIMLPESNEPFIEIIEHPKPRGFRFRYSCEGPSHGGIPGASSDRNRKNYPAVQIRNYVGYARIVVQLVTNEENPRLHPHSLVGKQCQNGICTVQCGPKDMTATFPNLGIQHVTKKNVARILEERYLAAEMQLSSVNEAYSQDIQNAIKEEDRTRLRAKAQAEAKSIDLSVVRLMFIAYLPDGDGAFTIMLKPVISDAIFDSKAPNAATLRICRMDRTHGTAAGKDEVYLLCDKVQKDDIQVRFYEEDRNGGEDVWEAYGNFSPSDVHRQFAIVFQTPAYRDIQVDHNVSVSVQLRRKSDGEVSEPKKYTYIPATEDPEAINLKRRKINDFFPDSAGDAQQGGKSGGYPFATNNLNTSGSYNFQTNGDTSSPNSGSNGSQRRMKPQAFPIDPTMLLKRVKTEPKVSCSFPQTYMPSPTKISSPAPAYIPGTQIPLPRKHIKRQPQPSLPHQTVPYQQVAPVQQDICYAGSPSLSTTSTSPQMYSASPQSTHSNISYQSSPYGSVDDDNVTEAEIINLFSTDDDGCFSSSAFLEPGMPGMDDFTTEAMDHRALSDIFFHDNGLRMDACKVNSDDEDDSDSDDEGFMPSFHHVDTIAKAKLLAKSDDTLSVDTLTDDVADVKLNAEEEDIPHHDVSNYGDKTEDRDKMNEDMQYLSNMDKTSLAALIWKMTENTSLALQDYAHTGDVVRLLTVTRYLATSQNEDGNTLLHTSLLSNQVPVFESLMHVIAAIPGGVDTVNTANNHGQTALHIAVQNEDMHAVKKLLEFGADVLKSDGVGNTSIHIACSVGHAKILACLLMHVNEEDDMMTFNLDGFSPMHMTCFAIIGARQCMKILLQRNVDINIQDTKSGRAPLHIAVEEKNIGIVGFLIAECFADIEARTFDGYTSLHIAAANDAIDAARLLLACGANTSAESMEPLDPDEDKELNDDEFGCMPIHLATTDQMYQLLSSDSETDEEPIESYDSIDDLDPVQRHQLCCLLDKPQTGHDWIELASALNLTPIVTSIKEQEKEKSPTDCLLDNYSCIRGKIAGLRSALEKIGRKDALKVIKDEELITTSPQVEQEEDEVKATLPAQVKSEEHKYDHDSLDRVESGIESMPPSITAE